MITLTAGHELQDSQYPVECDEASRPYLTHGLNKLNLFAHKLFQRKDEAAERSAWSACILDTYK